MLFGPFLIYIVNFKVILFTSNLCAQVLKYLMVFMQPAHLPAICSTCHHSLKDTFLHRGKCQKQGRRKTCDRCIFFQHSVYLCIFVLSFRRAVADSCRGPEMFLWHSTTVDNSWPTVDNNSQQTHINNSFKTILISQLVHFCSCTLQCPLGHFHCHH